LIQPAGSFFEDGDTMDTSIGEATEMSVQWVVIKGLLTFFG